MLWLFVSIGLAVSAVTFEADVDVVGTDDVKQDAANTTETKPAPAAAAAVASSGDTASSHTEPCTAMNANPEKQACDENGCFLRQLSDSPRRAAMSSKSGAVFWKSAWRQHLCKCPSCLVSYAVLHTSSVALECF